MNYSANDVELMAVVKALQYWRHYLIPKEFVLYSEHEASKYLDGQRKLSVRHAKWISQLQEFHFTLHYMSGSSNRVADALSRKHALVASMQIDVMRFDSIKEL